MGFRVIYLFEPRTLFQPITPHSHHLHPLCWRGLLVVIKVVIGAVIFMVKNIGGCRIEVHGSDGGSTVAVAVKVVKVMNNYQHNTIIPSCGLKFIDLLAYIYEST